MYLPKQFEENNPAVMHALMRSHAFATWIMAVDGELVINHLPFVLEVDGAGNGMLRSHLARANPAWRALKQGLTSVVVFQGSEHYISPSWYASKAEHGKVVPTWNYAVVHAHGEARAVHAHAWLLRLLNDLTAQHEQDLPAPWQVSDAPAGHVESLLDHIVGIELPITTLSGKWKTSQNRSAADRRSVIAGLRQHGGEAAGEMAALVSQHTPDEQSSSTGTTAS